jgi:putative oxidoreductase
MTLAQKFYRGVIAFATLLQSPLLLFIRLYWGWQLFLTGKGKLMDLAKPTQYFESLGIPFPHAQAILAACTECFGGLLLLVGLATRLISVPLMILLSVAYLTADRDAVKMIFSDPDKFLTADEFQFFFAVVLVFVFGPGKFSIDWLIKRKVAPPSRAPSPGQRSECLRRAPVSARSGARSEAAARRQDRSAAEFFLSALSLGAGPRRQNERAMPPEITQPGVDREADRNPEERVTSITPGISPPGCFLDCRPKLARR